MNPLILWAEGHHRCICQFPQFDIESLLVLYGREINPPTKWRLGAEICHRIIERFRAMGIVDLLPLY